MAFNPEIPDSGIPNFTGVSQGTGTDESFSSLFAGLSQTFSNITQQRDQATQTAIRNDANALFEQTNEEFGLSPTPDVSKTPSIFDLSVGQSTPAGMSGELDKISVLKNALDQGKISEVNYYGRLATLSKQLRTKYPRYEEIVDKTIQEVTGTRPANAYRDALFSEMNAAAQEASNEEKFKRQYQKEKADKLYLLYGDDYFNNPSNYDFNKVQAQVAGLEARDYAIQSQVADLGLQKGRNEVNQIQAEKTISQDFGLTVETRLNQAIGANLPSFNQSLQTFTAGKQTPEELNQFIGNISMLETNVRTELLSKANRTYAGIMTQDQINKAVENAMYPITAAKEAVLGGDFKLAARYATINKAATDQNLTILLNSKTFMAGMGLKEISPEAGELFVNQNYDEFETIALEAAGQVMAGRTGMSQDIVDSGNSRAARKYLDTSIDVITKSKVSGPQLSNLVNDLFGAQAPVWDKEVRPEDYEGLFLKFTNPAVSQAIASKGSAEDLQTYANWAQKAFLSIPSFRAAAGDISAHRENANISYDPGKRRLKIEGEGDRLFGYSLAATLSPAVNSLNRAFATLTPIIEASGEDPDVVIPRLIQMLNVNLENGNPQGFFKGIQDAISGAGSEGELPGSGGDDALAPLDDTGEIDFIDEPQGGDQTFAVEGPRGNSSYRDAIAGIESGGRYDIIGPRHKKMGRALGKYQVMEANLPAWSRAAIGREVSAEEFLATPGIQDAIFDYIFGNYVRRYGERGAAQAWFGGPGGVGKNSRKDSLGTSIGKYGDMFVSGLNRG